MTDPSIPADRFARSRALYERACRVLAGGVSSEFRKASHPLPLFYAGAEGARIRDVDGNQWLDFALSQGPMVLGHSHPEVLAAVAGATARGQLYAGQHEQELELAELIQRLVPCAERLRLSLSGSEADHAALRLARAATGRAKFLRFEGHYHGWFDNVALAIGGTSPDAFGPRDAPTPPRWCAGLPEDIERESITLPWNDLPAVERLLAQRAHEIAAIITEPVMANSGCIEPMPGFLAGLRALCDRHGIVLIFDEVITGFRLGLGGAQQWCGVTPDLGVFGKAMASGWPISVLAGRERFMRLVADGTVIHAGTMNSGVPGVAAALATLRIMERDRIHPHLFRMGLDLRQRLRDAAARAGVPALISGPGPMLHIGFHAAGSQPAPLREHRDVLRLDRTRGAAFVRALHDRGVRIIGRGLLYLSSAHTPADLDAFATAAAESFASVR